MHFIGIPKCESLFVVSLVGGEAQQENANSDNEELLETLTSFLGDGAAKLIVSQLPVSSPKTSPTHKPTPKVMPLLLIAKDNEKKKTNVEDEESSFPHCHYTEVETRPQRKTSPTKTRSTKTSPRRESSRWWWPRAGIDWRSHFVMARVLSGTANFQSQSATVGWSRSRRTRTRSSHSGKFGEIFTCRGCRCNLPVRWQEGLLYDLPMDRLSRDIDTGWLKEMKSESLPPPLRLRQLSNERFRACRQRWEYCWSNN